MAEMIPPAVITILAESTDVTTTIAKVKTELKDLATTVTNTRIGADEAPLDVGLATARTKLSALTKETWYAGLGVEIHNAEVAAQLAKLDAMIALAKTDVLVGV